MSKPDVEFHIRTCKTLPESQSPSPTPRSQEPTRDILEQSPRRPGPEEASTSRTEPSCTQRERRSPSQTGMITSSESESKDER